MDTTIACLTPPGKGAIATIGVRGPCAWQVTRVLFRPHKGELPAEPVAGIYRYGKLGIDHADDVILAVKQGGPEPLIELHCHGGVEVVRLIEDLYRERGGVLLTAQQFGNDPQGWLLAQTATQRAAGILLDQVGGAWERAIGQIDRAGADAEALVQRLAQLIPVGQHLVAPWRIVLAGAPNVGKSSLMNALAGYTRSVVAPTPGTTRDAVSVQLALDGWPVEITDTAGLRATTSDLERQGIERAHAAANAADMRIWLLDGANTPILPDGVDKWLLVINKIDQPPAWDWASVPQAQRISALTRTGLPELCELISRELVPAPPQPGEAVPVTAEQVAWPRKRLMASRAP